MRYLVWIEPALYICFGVFVVLKLSNLWSERRWQRRNLELYGVAHRGILTTLFYADHLERCEISRHQPTQPVDAKCTCGFEAQKKALMEDFERANRL